MQITKQHLLNLVDIACAAGDAIMAIYRQGATSISYKHDCSPVTAADWAAHEVIVKGLTQQFAGIPILSEETPDIEWEERQHWHTYWLVDPLDGTKEFIKRNGEFTVNIALVHQGIAVAGVVYVPVSNHCYYGAQHLGAWRRDIGQGKSQQIEMVLNGCHDSREVPVIVGSRSHVSSALVNYLQGIGAHQMMSVGSSLKFCLLAEGRADVYPRMGPTSEWDTAAAQAVLESAGGQVMCFSSGKPLMYNQKPEMLNPFFIATAPSWAKSQLP